MKADKIRKAGCSQTAARVTCSLISFAVLIFVACGEKPSRSTLRHAEVNADIPVINESGRSVVLTFDDVPGVGLRNCGAERLLTLNRQLLAGLKQHHIHAAALVVASRACDPSVLPEILNEWLTEGHELGNHSLSHLDLNRTPLETYLQDVEHGAAAIRRATDGSPRHARYFRHPFLHAGDTPQKKEGLERFLRSSGYEVAPVTIDNQEWVFAERYAEALERNDVAAIGKLLPAYLDHLEQSFEFYEKLSLEVFGREIPQVLLLHLNQLNADHLDEVVRLITGRGYRFVSLETALRDSAYRSQDSYVGARGLSWLQRWALSRDIPVPAEPREPTWVAGLYRE